MTFLPRSVSGCQEPGFLVAQRENFVDRKANAMSAEVTTLRDADAGCQAEEGERVVSMAPETEVLRVTTSDGRDAHMPLPVARMGTTLRNMLDDAGPSMEGPIPLCFVDARTLELIVAWGRLCSEEGGALPHGDDSDDGQEPSVLEKYRDDGGWQRKFWEPLERDLDLLLDVVRAANYLGMDRCLVGGCNTLAGMIANRTPRQIRAQFNIRNDLTYRDKNELRALLGWEKKTVPEGKTPDDIEEDETDDDDDDDDGCHLDSDCADTDYKKNSRSQN